MNREEAIKVNKNKYNECMKRRALIQSIYPNIQDAPDSIKKEYDSLGTLSHAMQRAMYGNITTKYVESSDGLLVDGFQQQNYEDALKIVSEQSSLNTEFITPEMESEFVAPTMNLDEISEKIANCKTASEMSKLDSEYLYFLKGGNYSFEELQKLDDIIKTEYKPKFDELFYSEQKEKESQYEQAEQAKKEKNKKPKWYQFGKRLKNWYEKMKQPKLIEGNKETIVLRIGPNDNRMQESLEESVYSEQEQALNIETISKNEKVQSKYDKNMSIE